MPTGTSLSHLRTTPLKELLRGKLNRLSPIQAALSRFKRAPPGKAQSALSDSIGSLPRPPGTVLVRQSAPSLPQPRQPAPPLSPTGAPRQPASLPDVRAPPISRRPAMICRRPAVLTAACSPSRQLIAPFGAPTASRPALHQLAEPTAHDDDSKGRRRRRQQHR